MPKKSAHVRINDELSQELDRWIAKQPVGPSRAAVVQRALEDFLEEQRKASREIEISPFPELWEQVTLSLMAAGHLLVGGKFEFAANSTGPQWHVRADELVEKGWIEESGKHTMRWETLYQLTDEGRRAAQCRISPVRVQEFSEEELLEHQWRENWEPVQKNDFVDKKPTLHQMEALLRLHEGAVLSELELEPALEKSLVHNGWVVEARYYRGDESRDRSNVITEEARALVEKYRDATFSDRKEGKPPPIQFALLVMKAGLANDESLHCQDSTKHALVRKGLISSDGAVTEAGEAVLEKYAKDIPTAIEAGRRQQNRAYDKRNGIVRSTG